jgi:uncharacterized protein YlxP (DUF503 family)
VYVEALRVRVHIPAARSLKDRRMVVRRAIDRVRARTGASISELGPLDRWQVAAFGLCAVSNDASVARAVLDKALSVIENAILGDAVVTSRERELRHYEDTQLFGEIERPAQRPAVWDDKTDETDDDDPRGAHR